MSIAVGASQSTWLEEFMANERLLAASGAWHGTGQGYSINYKDGTITSYTNFQPGKTSKMTDKQAKIYGAGAYYKDTTPGTEVNSNSAKGTLKAASEFNI
ncbi:MAG: hypothetical protein K8R69_02105 [Deltaproteobacteria bacterium]|nr:hypothetical protein [Deltaproteobacteria bacterium]